MLHNIDPYKKEYLPVQSPAGFFLCRFAELHDFSADDDRVWDGDGFDDIIFRGGLELDVSILEAGLPESVHGAADVLHSLEIDLGGDAVEKISLLDVQYPLVGYDPDIQIIIQPFDKKYYPQESIIDRYHQEEDVAVRLLGKERKRVGDEERIESQRQESQDKENSYGRHQSELVSSQDEFYLFAISLSGKGEVNFLLGRHFIFCHNFHKKS